ncbi:DUF4169 family protein [Phenylobacterium sp. 58.2.17]|uniref:DUF4169 family protein n=1 Tax=Phenylobacterium sp. 58.2.17 TaxID=2969306 RepID=UPI002263E352|nr:DUF4169 family protein [Phenylobacterium sp. 58.2.17]MCX7588003.1 DUF4169 family protein [Phenylobacterium sp. 58.2.17]
MNLNKARKARDRARAREQARENRVRFGRTKADKDLTSAELQKSEQALDGAKLDKPE